MHHTLDRAKTASSTNSKGEVIMKTLAIVSAVSMALFSVACGGSSPEAEVPEAAGAEEAAGEAGDQAEEAAPEETPAAPEEPAADGTAEGAGEAAPEEPAK
jgi:hypothetical protein